ncbi:WbqC family protein [Methylobacterium sp. J-076]|uniref:WbqC family protein n=1 Tax=Methylobacterium sp. J-076 TaxID=2836655 RepID=UPI001FBB0295|nr:WbqC family protein [Methylobacterium sp. J-076]MCJ2015713.1 WbqC family protein [Methylobacterium sp. J-076]
MRVAIMQPYLFPYIGYFQLIAAVDRFVIYDTVKYTKKGWINRNRFLRDGQPVTFTLPIARGADDLAIGQRHVAADFSPDRLCAQIAGAYRRAPFFAETMPLIESVLHPRAETLFGQLQAGLTRCCAHLGIATPILTASEVEGPTDLRRQDRVLALCRHLSATAYVNPIGGTALYDPAEFAAHGISLRFLKARLQPYPQFGRPFVPWLSIIDVLMFVGAAGTRATLLDAFDLVAGPEADQDEVPPFTDAA